MTDRRPPLPDAFLTRSLAHRGLHSQAPRVVENSRAAFRAACESGYGIELDVQMSQDGEAMVFHDKTLDRLTRDTGSIRDRSAAELAGIGLLGSFETIPTLDEILSIVDGCTPILVDMKDQDGALGPNVGRMERQVASLLAAYHGPVACVSFNPHSVAAVRATAPGLPLGLVTGDFQSPFWKVVPRKRRDELRAMPDLSRVGAAFISHDHRDLSAAPVSAAKASGLTVLCWTIRSEAEERAARRIADNITFEGYLPRA